MILFVMGMTGCGQDKVKTFTAFIATPGKNHSGDNRIGNAIAEKIGARAEVSYLPGQTEQEYIASMIQQKKYPDFIDGIDATELLLEAKAYIPLEDYLDNYPNIKNLFTQEEWNRLRQSDGHIYFIPQFSKINGKQMDVQHADEAFWIQKRVLEWADYPEIQTLDEYFALIEEYIKENPVTEDGEENIGFEILCDDWRYFCLENVPQFLAGCANDGCAMVDEETLEVSVYDTIPEAKQYYKKLSEEYDKGIIDPEAFTQSYQQYLKKVANGNVLGMVDQYWQFQDAEDILNNEKMYDRTYVPLGITIDKSVQESYRSMVGINTANGLGISVSCQDVEGALKFLNDLLSQKIITLRFWGEEGIDYLVDENGIFYRTEEQRQHFEDSKWKENNLCVYDYFPHYEGMMEDGMNAVHPEQQPGEYYATLNEVDKRILDAYDYEKWIDFLNPPKENAPWYPLYTAVTTWSSDTEYGQAHEKMAEVKHEWLPKIIMTPAEEFEMAWEQYMKVYEEQVNVDAYEEELEREVIRRIALSEGK